MNSTLVLLTDEDDAFEIIQVVVHAPPILVAPRHHLDIFQPAKPVQLVVPREKIDQAPRELIIKPKRKKHEISAGPEDGDFLVQHMYLVRQVVDRIKLNLPQHIDADDLHSVGITGLMAAAKKYDVARASSFKGYAAMRIRGAILDELRRMDWVPRRARARNRVLKEVVATLMQKLQRDPTAVEIMTEMNLTPAEYRKMVEEARPQTFTSIDFISESEEHGVSLHESLADTQDVLARDSMQEAELVGLLKTHISRLPDQWQTILRMNYFEGMRLWQIAEEFKVTESRICQIRQDAINQLKKWVVWRKDR